MRKIDTQIANDMIDLEKTGQSERWSKEGDTYFLDGKEMFSVKNVLRGNKIYDKYIKTTEDGVPYAEEFNDYYGSEAFDYPDGMAQKETAQCLEDVKTALEPLDDIFYDKNGDFFAEGQLKTQIEEKKIKIKTFDGEKEVTAPCISVDYNLETADRYDDGISGQTDSYDDWHEDLAVYGGMVYTGCKGVYSNPIRPSQLRESYKDSLPSEKIMADWEEEHPTIEPEADPGDDDYDRWRDEQLEKE